MPKIDIYFSWEITTNIHFINIPKIVQIFEGIMLIFAPEKNRP